MASPWFSRQRAWQQETCEPRDGAPIDLAGFQAAEPEWTVGRAAQPVHRMAHMFKRPPDLPVTPLRQFQPQPGVGASPALDRHAHREKLLARNRQSRPKRVQRAIIRRPANTSPIDTQDATRREFQVTLERTVVGQKEETLRGRIQSADRHHSLQAGRQRLAQAASALRVGS